jgi:hypothetical protein
MRYRELSPTGDYVFSGNSRFLTNTPAAVAQAVATRLRLFTEEWFLDKRIGLDRTQILGYNTAATRDPEVQRRILQTEGVTELLSYSSTVEDRGFRVAAVIDTIYGQATINEVL